MVIDRIADVLGLSGKREETKNSLIFNHPKGQLVLAKPLTFVNNSGGVVRELVDRFLDNTSDLWVIFDDLDLRLGEWKIQMSRGPKLHRGLKSIEKHLRTKDFWRVRIGVDNRGVSNRVPGEVYVLSSFTDDEFLILNNVICKVADELVKGFGLKD
jgi:PTH1 family peptidyl-tRNA hydrolase